eukprot:gene12183-25579_t
MLNRTVSVFYVIVIGVFRVCLSKYVAGIDAGTESIRVGIFDSTGHLAGTGVVPYVTLFPKPGWAEQIPSEWYSAMGQACKLAIENSCISSEEIIAISMDTTACSVVTLDENMEPLRPCLLWMDARSATQTKYILEKGNGDPALQVNCNGQGPLSAEWMIPKSLWLKQNEPDIWNKAKYICEKQDYLNYKLTGRLCTSSCNVAARWHWNGETATSNIDTIGRPISLLEKLDLLDLQDKWPKTCIATGAILGSLTEAAAAHLGLQTGIPLCQGGPDAYIGMIGLGCVHPGQLALITGSSHLHLCVAAAPPTHAPGVWGAYCGAPLPGLCFAEGGQSSTGSILSWARKLFSSRADSLLSYKELDDEASQVPIGAEGLIALETFQGSRTPVTDALARGALLGLTLSHSRAHIWRALLEAVCMGTRAALEALYAAGYGSVKKELLVAGGASRSEFWLQMHADVTGLTVIVGEFDNAPLLGAAILAAVGGRLFTTVEEAVQAMVRPLRRIEPRPEMKAVYDKVYEVYKTVATSIAHISHTLATGDHLRTTTTIVASSPATAASSTTIKEDKQEELKFKNTLQSSLSLQELPSGREGLIVPSILAADLTALSSEINICVQSGTKCIHIDVCDGNELCQRQLTFGPLLIESIHRSFPTLLLDAHVVTRHPEIFVKTMADSGAGRFTFQWESVNGLEEARSLAESIRSAGMRCGVCITPNTPIEVIFPLLDMQWNTGNGNGNDSLIELVDILGVEPGVGGQQFNRNILEKIRKLREMYPLLPYIAVDGGVNVITAIDAVQAGANVLIAGTSIFGNKRNNKDG